MNYAVTIRFREHTKRSLTDIKNIIFTIPGTLKAGHSYDSMKSMLTGSVYTLTYDTKENADKVADAIFCTFSNIVDVQKKY